MLAGTFNMLRYAAQLIAKYELKAGEEERGVIVNTASVAAFDGQIGQSRLMQHQKVQWLQ